jgi:hypothetical protein
MYVRLIPLGFHTVREMLRSQTYYYFLALLTYWTPQSRFFPSPEDGDRPILRNVVFFFSFVF